ncbi:MAG: methyltransferase [Ferruginibacter sp.]
MANQFFRFKQFTIQQQMTAMKVCTDSCILGAWTAKDLQTRYPSIKNILDIGTGTGLLALMLAQKTTADITAIEIDKHEVEQAKENFAGSPWNEKIDLVNIRLQDFFPLTQFDCIISNPPFYENDLPSADERKSEAKHDTSLTLSELSSGIRRLLAPTGIAYVLLPRHRYQEMKHVALIDGLHEVNALHIRQSPTHDFFRSIIILGREPLPQPSISELIIHDEQRNYTRAFIDIMKDYYEKL